MQGFKTFLSKAVLFIIAVLSEMIFLTGAASASFCGGSHGGDFLVVGTVSNAHAVYEGPAVVLGPIDFSLGGERVGSRGTVRVVRLLRGDLNSQVIEIHSNERYDSGIPIQNGLHTIGLTRNAESDDFETDYCSFDELGWWTYRDLVQGNFGRDPLSEIWKASVEASHIWNREHEAVPGKENLAKVDHLLRLARDWDRLFILWTRAAEQDSSNFGGLLKLYVQSDKWHEALALAPRMAVKDRQAEIFFEIARLSQTVDANKKSDEAPVSEQIRGDLSDLDLSGVDFDGFGVSGVAQRTKFSGFMSDIEFEGDFRGASFESSVFEGSSISGQTGSADLRKIDFRRGRLELGENMDLTRAIFGDTVVFGNGSNADLSGSQARAIHFSDPSHTTFEGAIFKGARIDSVDASGVTFKGVDMTDVEVFDTSFKHSKFEGANLATGRFYDVEWTGATFDCSTTFPEGFDPFKEGMIGPSAC